MTPNAHPVGERPNRVSPEPTQGLGSLFFHQSCPEADQGALCPEELAGGLSSPVISPWAPVREEAGRYGVKIQVGLGHPGGWSQGHWSSSLLSLPHYPTGCGGGTSGGQRGPIFEPPGFEGQARAFKVLPILQTGAEGLG